MRKEVKFYLALTLIGLCISGAVYFYNYIEYSELVDAYKEHGSTRGKDRNYHYITPKVFEYRKNGDMIIKMCLCLVPILPLSFFAKNNRP